MRTSPLDSRPRYRHRRRPRSLAAATLAAIAALVAVGSSAPAGAKDCGDRPTGKNPTVEELAAAIEELSLAFQVPTEVIKAVAHRESGVQQWKPDGSLVINETDCGFGMMQLTGATAEEFDVERLKSDWRYNLEAGVTVLQAKWQRGLRTYWQGKPVPAPEPRVLENWYYALSLYQGKRTGEYPGKVFDHMKDRPGKLQKLLAAPVEVSNPEKAIPGFAYGQLYTALAGNRIALEDGRTVEVRTTLGTIGDPALLAELDKVLERADRERERGSLLKAIRYYRLVAERRADAPQGRRALEALTALAKAARALVDEGQRLRAEGDHAGALVAFDACESRYRGLAEAEEAAGLADAIRRDPALASRAAELEAEKDARALLDKARAARERGQLVEAARAFEACSERYPATAAATAAEDELRRLRNDPALGAALAVRERERALQRALGLGESYLANERYDAAIERFEEALRLAPPDGPLRRRAEDGLSRAREAAGR